jgi:hypothetical protein
MSATSVTGKGAGDSYGLHKPELQCGGCGCGSFTEDEEESIVVRRGCVTKNKSGGSASVKSGSGASIKVC